MTTTKKLCFKTQDGYLFILPKDIFYAKSFDIYAYIYQDNKQHFINCSLKNLEKKLPKEIFLRCHRSYIVNIEKVAKIIRSKNINLELENGHKVPVSRARRSEIMSKLGVA